MEQERKELAPYATNENAPQPEPRTNEQRLRDAGIEFDFFVDSCEGPAYSFDEVAVAERAEAARIRLLADGIPKLGEIAIK